MQYEISIKNFSKIALKGINLRQCSVNKDMFLDSLHTENTQFVKQTTMSYSKKHSSMTIASYDKKLFNNVYTKMMVDDDKITCHPIKYKNKYV